MTDRALFRLVGTGALAAACLFAGRAGWAIGCRNGAAVVLTFGALSLLCSAASVLLWAMKGGDDGID